MIVRIVLVCSVLAALSSCHPTMYKRNQYDNLEPDMIAVSSTVIPLPDYKVGTHVENVETGSDKTPKTKYNSMSIPLKQYLAKLHKSEEPFKLITVHTKKAAYQELKQTKPN